MRSLKLIFYRHGYTKANERREYIGCARDLPLSPFGRQELAAKKERVSEEWPLNMVFSSPLKRPRETAAIYAPMFMPVLLDGLRERDFGPFEGFTYEELKGHPAFQKFIASNGLEVPPGMETAAAFSARVGASCSIILDFGREILRYNDTAKIAVFSHGGVIMQATKLLAEHYGGPQLGFYDYQLAPGDQVDLDFSLDEAGCWHWENARSQSEG